MAEAGEVRVNTFVERQIDSLASKIEERLNADAMAIIGPILYGAEAKLRDAIEKRSTRRAKLALLVDTDGGVIEVVERMVNVIRHHYNEVTMIVADRAMSAGTVFVMSGDGIMMDYFGCLGPIDPQVERDGKLVPALSYLVQFERLKERAASGELTTAEIALLQRLDLAELHGFEEARELTNTLLTEWLTKYKFKNWRVTQDRKIAVTDDMRKARAREIASKLAKHDDWHSHGRPISMQILKEKLNLKIDDYGSIPELRDEVRGYHQFLADYMQKISAFHVVHGKGACLFTPAIPGGGPA